MVTLTQRPKLVVLVAGGVASRAHGVSQRGSESSVEQRSGDRLDATESLVSRWGT